MEQTEIEGVYLTFDDLIKEYERFTTELPEEQQVDVDLWNKFLLGREDDGSYIFARALQDALHSARRNIVKEVEGGNIQRAIDLGKLTRKMGERHDLMYREVTGPGGETNFVRAKSPIPSPIQE